MNKKKRFIYISIIFVLLLCLILLLLKCCHSPETEQPPNLTLDNDAVSWQGEQPLQNAKTDKKEIAIPGFTSLVFTANQTAQKVNFYNPESNNCLFLFQLIIDDSILWESGYCPPGNGYYNIELTEPLQNGEYNGLLKIQCFRETGEQLNGASVKFDLIVQED